MKTLGVHLEQRLTKNATYKETFQSCINVLDKHDFFIASEHFDQGVIQANTCISKFSWGCDLNIEIKKGNKMKIKFSYVNCNFIEWIQMKRNGRVLLKEIEANLN